MIIINDAGVNSYNQATEREKSGRAYKSDFTLCALLLSFSFGKAVEMKQLHQSENYCHDWFDFAFDDDVYAPFKKLNALVL